MSLFQPTNIIPSTFAPVGNSTVAQTDNVNIQWQINGSSPLSNFEVDIFTNDAASALVHTTGVLAKSASGTDAKGNPVPAVYAPSNTTWAGWNLANGNSYKMRIIQFGASTTVRRAANDNSIGVFEGDNYCIYNDVNQKYYIFTSPVTYASSDLLSIDIFDNVLIFNYDSAVSNHTQLAYTSAVIRSTNGGATQINTSTTAATVPFCVIPNTSSVFYVMQKPALTVSPSIPSVITTISYDFLFLCSSVGLKWSRWVLTKSDGTVVDDTGEITTASNNYTYDGFINGDDYVLTRTVEDIYGVQATASHSFSVEYISNLEVSVPVSVCINPEDASANIEWSDSSNIPGALNSGSANYDDSNIILSSGQSVTWNSVNGAAMNFTAPFQIAWHGRVPSFENSAIYNLVNINNGDGTLWAGNGGFLWFVTPGTISQIVYIPCYSDATYMTVLVRDIGIAVWYYDSEGRWINDYMTIHYYDTDMPTTITSIKISGEQQCDWLCVTANDRYGFMYTDGNQHKPSWDKDMLFYADFNGSLEAGFSLSNAAKCYVYREDMTNGIMRFIGSTDTPSGSVKDYGIKSLSDNRYYVVCYDSQNVIISYATTQTVCKQFTALYLYEAAADDTQEDVFHVVRYWRFGNNFSNSTISNNNSPQFLTNFTKYPLRQGVSALAKSGTLTALLSNFYGLNEYEDTASQMDALFNLSLSENHVFLKDTKGNMYEVHTSSPITQTINTATRIQEVTVSVPWQEIADASNASLIT